MGRRTYLLFRPICVTFGLALSVNVAAQELSDDVLNPYTAYTISHDDNLLRFSDLTQAEALTGTRNTADFSHRFEAGLRLNKTLGRQQIFANFNIHNVRFNRYRQLDHTAHDVSMRLRWQLGSQIEGAVGASYVKSLTPFIEFRGLAANLRKQNRHFVDAYWRLHPSWRLVGGASHYALRYDLPAQQPADRNDRMFQVGVDFLPRSANSIGARIRRIDGDFRTGSGTTLLAAGSDFTQDELLGRAEWRVSGKTALRISAGFVERSHASLRERSWSGFNGRAEVDWLATGKSSVSFAAWRETGSYLDLTSSYTVNRGLSVTPAWNITEKLRLDGTLRFETREFDGAGILVGGPRSDRKDDFRYFALAMTYQPTHHAELKTGFFRDERTSNVRGIGYAATGAFISARYTF